MLERFFYALFFVFITTTGFSQSKKEQIETLTVLTDSLKNALFEAKNETARIQTKALEEQGTLNSEIEKLNTSLKAELTKVTKLEDRIGTLEGDLKKSEEAIALLKQAEEQMKRNSLLTMDSLKNATESLKTLHTAANKSKEELDNANKKLTEAHDKIAQLEVEKGTLQSTIQSAGKNYFMDETAVNFHKAKGEIEKLIGPDNLETLKVIFSYLDAKYGEFKAESNMTPEDIAEMEETGSDFGEGGTFLIELKVNDFNAKFIQVEITSSFYQGAGGEGRFVSSWYFDKTAGIKYEWNNFVLENKKEALLAILNKKLKTMNSDSNECGMESEQMQELSISEYDLNGFSFTNGKYLFPYNPANNGMGPCEFIITVTAAEMKPFLNSKYFP